MIWVGVLGVSRIFGWRGLRVVGVEVMMWWRMEVRWDVIVKDEIG